jgi:hypothetical protein
MEEKAIQLFTRFTNVNVLYRTHDGEYFVEEDDAQKHVTTLGSGAYTTVNRIDPLPPVEEVDPNTPVWVLINEPLSLNKSLGFDGCISFSSHPLVTEGEEVHLVNRTGAFTVGNFVIIKARTAPFRAKYGQITAISQNLITINIKKVYGEETTPITSWEMILTGEMITSYEIALEQGYNGTAADWVNDAINGYQKAEAARDIAVTKATEATAAVVGLAAAVNSANAARDIAVTKATEATAAAEGLQEAVETSQENAAQSASSAGISTTKAAESTTNAAAAVAAKIAAESYLSGLTAVNGDLGAYNAATDTPALTATPSGSIADGRYYTVTVAGTVGFAGNNFASGATLQVGDKLLKLSTQWYLESNRPVGSVAEGDGRSVSGNTVFENLQSIKQKTKALQNTLVDEEFGIADEAGNVAFKVDTEGLTSFLWLLSNLRLNLEKVGFQFDEDGNVVINTAVIDWAKKLYDKGLLVTDASGNVALKVDEKGLETTHIKASTFDLPIEPNSGLYGKTIFSICDSLGIGGYWQSAIAEMHGAIWLDKYRRVTNQGGTRTQETTKGFRSGFCRARALKKINAYQPVDFVFVENINDGSIRGGSFNEEPYFESQILVTNSIIGEEEDVSGWLEENIAAVLASARTYDIDPETNLWGYGEEGDFSALPHSLLWVRKENSGLQSWKIVITSPAASSGLILITTARGSYGVTIASGDTDLDIYAKILENDFRDMVVYYTNESDPSEGVSFNYTNPSLTAPVTVNWGATGVIGTVTPLTGGYDHIMIVYKSLDTANWNNGEYWVRKDSYQPEYGAVEGEFGPSLYQMYKGLIEYLQKELPEATIIWVYPTGSLFNYGDLAAAQASNPEYFYPSGQFNFFNYYNARLSSRENLVNVLSDLTKKYGVRLINLEEEAGVSLINGSHYYNSNDIHPKTVAYIRWAKTISRILLYR